MEGKMGREPINIGFCDAIGVERRQGWCKEVMKSPMF